MLVVGRGGGGGLCGWGESGGGGKSGGVGRQERVVRNSARGLMGWMNVQCHMLEMV